MFRGPAALDNGRPRATLSARGRKMRPQGNIHVYARPSTIEEAARAMSVPGALALCGGTDVYPAHVGRSFTRPLVDLSGVAGLRCIEETPQAFRFGATTTWSMIAGASLPKAFDGLKAAAREVGSIQIQNRGTIGGNLCNASPAADGVPPLLCLDASVEIASGQGRRVMALSVLHHRLPPHRAEGGGDRHRRARSETGSWCGQCLRQAGCAALSGDFDPDGRRRGGEGSRPAAS